MRQMSRQRPTLRSAMSAFGLDPGAPALMRADYASLHPLAVHEYVFGVQSCTIRLA